MIVNRPLDRHTGFGEPAFSMFGMKNNNVFPNNNVFLHVYSI